MAGLAQARHRMGAPRDLAVEEIGGGGHGEPEGGRQVVTIQKQDEVGRHHEQAHEGDDVGQGEDPVRDLLGRTACVLQLLGHRNKPPLSKKSGPPRESGLSCQLVQFYQIAAAFKGSP